MEVTLYGTGANRSTRCRWVLDEAGVAYTSIDRREAGGADGLRKLHPLAKVPVAVINGQTLYESAAICTYIADLVPSANLIAGPGSFERATHDQWVAFCLTEMESWLWNTGVNTYVLPEEQRVTAGFEQNVMMFKRSAQVLEVHLAEHDYIVGDRFSVTDIIVSWCVNWGRRQGHLDECPSLSRYLERLFTRPLCVLAKD